MEQRLIYFLKNSAQALGVALSAEHLAQFAAYFSLLHFWNQKINLFAPLAPEEFIIKHFVDSLAPIPCCVMTNKTVVDIGSGAGLPAIPLAIAAGLTKIILVESIRKKASFLREALAALSLSNAVIANEHLGAAPPTRRDNAPVGTQGQVDAPFVKGGVSGAAPGCTPLPSSVAGALADGCDIVISRAALQLPQMQAIASRLLAPNGVLLAMRGSRQEVLPNAGTDCAAPRHPPMRLLAQHPYILPGKGGRRCIMIFERQEE